MNIEHLKTESLALDFSARKELAYLLLDSLMAESSQPLHPEWKTEIDRRWVEVEAGAALLRDAETVERQLAAKHSIPL